MTYTVPWVKQGVIHLPTQSFSPVTVYRGDSNFLLRSEVGQYTTEETSVLGAAIIERGGIFYPYYRWSGSFIVTENDLALIERFHALIQQDPTLQVTFTDEFYYVDAVKAAWHNRLVVSGSTKTVNTISKSICSYNVFLEWTQPDNPFRLLGRGNGLEWYSVDVQLTELI